MLASYCGRWVSLITHTFPTSCPSNSIMSSFWLDRYSVLRKLHCSLILFSACLNSASLCLLIHIAVLFGRWQNCVAINLYPILFIFVCWCLYTHLLAEGYVFVEGKAPTCKPFSISIFIMFIIVPLDKASFLANWEFVWEEITQECITRRCEQHSYFTIYSPHLLT